MWDYVIVLCFAVRYFMSILVLQSSRELVALLSVSSCCLMMVVWLFLMVPQVCLQFVIVVFPDDTHFLFLMSTGQRPKPQEVQMHFTGTKSSP